ncbi:Rib/alpha-like domain-containing protein [Limosilactobacillus albertensis]|uniref:LPXTG cell wall anchor domain-containing protein n=1 Tax=Limosilactobacillus albertensis TaxID=2759752 RepID=A0A839H7F5_9LACO|nr:Rib/alpha-like domain-containing protein [Limosilactobacillus albertensis]MBB1122458.1 LPXTG cell wall anchor domain-containing protein [Limosilactobacillus albertensis]MCD7121367.1 LPXTG cell wall anchor domain-containing protein [Limosilactobacillus albertensis]
MNKTKKEIITGAAVIASLGATGTTVTAHADSVTKPTQAGQNAYQQKVKQNEQQLSDLASTNASKEQKAADSYAAANSANAVNTDQQIAAVRNQFAQHKQQAAGQIAAASSAKDAQINNQTTIINQEAAAATQKQQSANTASEARLQSANSTAIAQAEKQASDAAAHATAAIKEANANYQKDVNNAKNLHNSTIKNANDSYQHDLSDENRTYDSNKKQLQDGVTAAQKAVNEAQKIVNEHHVAELSSDRYPEVQHRVAQGYIPSSDADYNKGLGLYLEYGKTRDPENPAHENLAYLQLGGFDIEHDSRLPKSIQMLPNIPESAIPHAIDEMPLTFKPGLLAYDPSNDNSDHVGSEGLTDNQIAIATAFLTSWSNDFRQELYHNYPELYAKLTSANYQKGAGNIPLPIINTEITQQLGNDIARLRSNEKMGNNTHTAVADNTNFQALFEKYDFATDPIQKKLKQIFPNEPFFTFGANFGHGECLETMVSPNSTFLNYLVNLYNMTQNMYWAEALNQGGHAVCAADNIYNAVAISFERVNNVTPPVSSKENSPAYAVTTNWLGLGFLTGTNDVKTINKANQFKLNLPQYYDQIYGNEIHNATVDEIRQQQAPQFVARQTDSKTAALTHGDHLTLSDYQEPLTDAEKQEANATKAYQFTFDGNDNLSDQNLLVMRYDNLNGTFKTVNGDTIPVNAVEYHFGNLVPANNSKCAIRVYDTPNGFSLINAKSVNMVPYYFTKDADGVYHQIDTTNGVLYVSHLVSKFTTLSTAPQIAGRLVFPVNAALPNPHDIITNLNDYPQGTTVNWADNNIPVLGQTSKDLIFNFFNGDSETVAVPITVLPMNKFYQPTLKLNQQVSYNYGHLPKPTDFIQNADTLPAGTNISFDKLETPDADSNSQNQLAVLKIAYPDGTIGYSTVTLNLKQMAGQYFPVAKAVTYAYGATPDPNAALDLGSSFMPSDSNDYHVEWVTTPDTTQVGLKAYKAKVVFADGSSKDILVDVTINQSNSHNYTLTIDPMKHAGLNSNEPASYFIDPTGLPAGTQYEWIKAPDFSQPGTQNVTIKATFPDGSTKTVSGNVDIDFFASSQDTTASTNMNITPKSNAENKSNNSAAYQTLSINEYWNQIKQQKSTITSSQQLNYLGSLAVIPSNQVITGNDFALSDQSALTNRYDAMHNSLQTNVTAKNATLIAIAGNTSYVTDNHTGTDYSSDDGAVAVKFTSQLPEFIFNIDGEQSANEKIFFGLSTSANNQWTKLLAQQKPLDNEKVTLKRYITIVNPDGTQKVITQLANNESTKQGTLYSSGIFSSYQAPKIAGYQADNLQAVAANHDIADTILYRPAGTEATKTLSSANTINASDLVKSINKDQALELNDIQANNKLNINNIGVLTAAITNVPKTANAVSPDHYQQLVDNLTRAKANLNQATDKLKDLNSTHENSVKKLNEIKDNALKQAEADFETAVKGAAKTRDDKIAEAKGSHNRVDALKQELSQKYQALVKEDQAKLAQIENDRQNRLAEVKMEAQNLYEAKLKSLGVDEKATEAKVNTLLSAHQKFVKANADKLAALKVADTRAYNDLKAKLDQELAMMISQQDKENPIINTGDHTVVLPGKKSASNDGRKAVAQNKIETTNTGTHLAETPGMRVANVAMDRGNVSVSNGIIVKNSVAKSNTKQQQLPQTGNASAWMASVLGVLGAMFGLGLLRKKRY